MPRFIGNSAPANARQIQDNAQTAMGCHVRLTYAQVRLLPPGQVIVSLDTSDKGSAGRRAKRWWRWFADPRDVLSNPDSTPNMVKRSYAAIKWQDGKELTNCGTGVIPGAWF